MKEKEFFRFLLERYVNGTASEEEVKELFDELEKRKDDVAWEDMIAQMISETPKDPHYDESFWQPSIQKILATASEQIPVRKMNRMKWLVAASVAVIAIATVYLLLPSGNQQHQTTTASTKAKDIEPGHQGAILTLADHSQVLLDTIKNGSVLALQGGSSARVVDGSLVYDTKGSEITYNTISTPKGRQYRVTLPDGTIVWLNSGSSVHYPTVFKGNERIVDITGEAYLEVTRNAKMPFKVNLENKTSIQVLGTSFNVNAYTDEPFIRTTLVEGSISVNNNKQHQKLIPGQQAQINGEDEIKVTEANISQVIAWKEGLFDFNNRDVKSVLREIARWYDLELVYESEPTVNDIVGKMQRNLALSQVMLTLSDLDIHYRIEGRKLIVSK